MAASLSVTCGISTHNWDISGESSFYSTQDLYFIAKNNNNTNDKYNVSVYREASSLGNVELNSNSNWTNLNSIGKLSAGSYTYSVHYNGSEICSHSITVTDPVGCSVNKESIGLGENFTFNTSYPGSCYNSTFTGSGSGHGVTSVSECQSSYIVTPTAMGTFTYTYSVTNGGYGTGSCSKSVTVNEVAPTITCPANQTGKTTGSIIKVTPAALTGCTSGCSYAIEGSAATGSGYTGGELSFTGESSAQTKEYTFSVTNSVSSASCKFSVEYVAPASSSSGSGNEADYILCLGNDNGGWPQITSGISTVGNYKVLHDCKGTNSYSYFYNCSNGASISWNGNTLTCDGNEHQSSTTSMPASGTILTINSGAISKKGCERSSGTSPCATTGITSNTASSSSGTTSSGSAVSVPLTYGSYVPFTPGNSYNVTMAGGSKFRCTVNESSSSNRNLGTFNGQPFTLDAWQTQATTDNPGPGTTVPFVVSVSAPDDLKCSTDW